MHSVLLNTVISHRHQFQVLNVRRNTTVFRYYHRCVFYAVDKIFSELSVACFRTFGIRKIAFCWQIRLIERFLASGRVSACWWNLSICGSLNDALRCSDCTASNCRMVNEWQIGKDVEGDVLVCFKVLSRHSPGSTVEIHENPQL